MIYIDRLPHYLSSFYFVCFFVLSLQRAFRSKYSPEGQVERKIIIVVTLRRPYDPAAAVLEKSTSEVV